RERSGLSRLPLPGLAPFPAGGGGSEAAFVIALPGFAPSPACGGRLGWGRPTRARPLQASANHSKIAPPACPHPGPPPQAEERAKRASAIASAGVLLLPPRAGEGWDGGARREPGHCKPLQTTRRSRRRPAPTPALPRKRRRER